MKWCRTTILEYKQQLEKIFGDRAASSEKAASISTLQNNTATSNDVFDSRLLANTGEQDVEENSQGDSLYLGRIVTNIQGAAHMLAPSTTNLDHSVREKNLLERQTIGHQPKRLNCIITLIPQAKNSVNPEMRLLLNQKASRRKARASNLQTR